jgi:hypothetical protein
MQIKHRTIQELVILTLVTFGAYPLFWFFKTRKEINSLGANIPSAWLLFLPFGNLYFNYKYAQAFDQYVKKDGLALIYFIISIIPFILININPVFAGFNSISLGFSFYWLKAMSNYLFFLSIIFIPMMVFQMGLNDFVEKRD